MSNATVTGISRASSIKSAMHTVRDTRGQARQFWRVFDRSFVPMVLVDNQRRYLAANAAARLVFRLSLDEFLTRKIEDLTPPHMLSRLHERWGRLILDGAVSGPYDVSFPDGSGLQIVYCALANVLPAQHLIVFVPATWPDDELIVDDERGTKPAVGRLSSRERQVLSLIAAGAGLNEIAEELTITTSTVRTHTRNALRKLGAHNRAHAIALAIRDGILDLPGWDTPQSASSG